MSNEWFTIITLKLTKTRQHTICSQVYIWNYTSSCFSHNSINSYRWIWGGPWSSALILQEETFLYKERATLLFWKRDIGKGESTDWRVEQVAHPLYKLRINWEDVHNCERNWKVPYCVLLKMSEYKILAGSFRCSIHQTWHFGTN